MNFEEASNEEKRCRLLFLECIRTDDFDAVSAILSTGLNPNYNQYNLTPLGLAVARGNARMVEVLLQAGANPDKPCRSGRSFIEQPLLLTALEKYREDILMLLLKHGANTDVTNSSRFTALHEAVVQQNLHFVQILLRFGASPNLSDYQRKSSLYHACSRNDIECARILLEHGADPTLPTSRLQTAFHQAALCGNRALVELLLAHKAKLNLQDDQLETPLHSALRSKVNSVVAVLIAAGADVNIRDIQGSTPLRFAWWKENRIGLVLLAHGGCALHGEDWIRTVSHDTCFAIQALDVVAKMTEMRNACPSLQQLARLSIRAVITAHSDGCDIRPQLAKLALPSRLHDFVAFKDLEDLAAAMTFAEDEIEQCC